MKTISELKVKMWYRALKVIFIISFIFSQVIIGISVYFGVSEQRNLVVNCDNGKKIIKDQDTLYTDVQKYMAYRECSESDYQLTQSKNNYSRKVLSEYQRNELDVIVKKMIDERHTDLEIQSYVDNYKELNGLVFDPTKYGAVVTEKGKSYTQQEVFGNMDLSNGWIKKPDEVSILANYKITYETKYSQLAIFGFILLGIITTALIFWVIARTSVYILIGEKFFNSIKTK